MNDYENSNTLFPVFLRPDRLNIMIVGGGKAAAEKLHFMLKSSPEASMTVVAPKISSAIAGLAEKHRNTRIILRKYRKETIAGNDIVIAATDDAALNRSIRRDAKSENMLVNVVDTPELCDFYMGAIVTRGNLKLAISTNGKSPTFAKRFRKLLEDLLPEELPETLINLHRLRASLRTGFSEKVRELNKITSILVIENENDKPGH